MGWIIFVLIGVLLAGWGAFSYAIRTNGPAVLDTVDRVTGGSRDVELRHAALFGSNPAQKIHVFGQEGDDAVRPVIVFVTAGPADTRTADSKRPATRLPAAAARTAAC